MCIYSIYIYMYVCVCVCVCVYTVYICVCVCVFINNIKITCSEVHRYLLSALISSKMSTSGADKIFMSRENKRKSDTNVCMVISQSL